MDQRVWWATVHGWQRVRLKQFSTHGESYKFNTLPWPPGGSLTVLQPPAPVLEPLMVTEGSWQGEVCAGLHTKAWHSNPCLPALRLQEGSPG